jgi:hypothetical protein
VLDAEAMVVVAPKALGAAEGVECVAQADVADGVHGDAEARYGRAAGW